MHCPTRTPACRLRSYLSTYAQKYPLLETNAAIVRTISSPLPAQVDEGISCHTRRAAERTISLIRLPQSHPICTVWLANLLIHVGSVISFCRGCDTGVLDRL
jgi:hypothetical protein